MFSSHARFEVGDGFKIRFWHDMGGDKALKAFLDLYSIACVKDVFVAVHLELSSGSQKWNTNFIRVTMIGRWMYLLHFSICCTPLE
jgi:hypothetical protein